MESVDRLRKIIDDASETRNWEKAKAGATKPWYREISKSLVELR